MLSVLVWFGATLGDSICTVHTAQEGNMSEDFTEGYKVLWGMAIPKARGVPDTTIILGFPPSAEF